MVPTLAQVNTAIRAVLGDVVVPTGEVYTDVRIQPHVQFSYSELFRALQSSQNPRIRRESYYNLPANTGYLNPITAFIFNMGEPETVEARINVTSWNIASFTAGSGFATITTSTPTTLVSGNQAVVYGLAGVTDDVNDRYTVTVNSPTSIQLDGCTAVAIGTPDLSKAIISFSTEHSLELAAIRRISWGEGTTPGTRPQVYAWEGSVLRVPPSSGVVQLRITYYLSGNMPTLPTQSMGIDDSLGFLSYRGAGLAALSEGMIQRATKLEELAVGPDWISKQFAGGILGQLMLPGTRNMQREPPSQRRSPPFGRVRNRRWYAW